MTINTLLFNKHKKDGNMEKHAKVWIKDGTRHIIRTSYLDKITNERIVFVDGEVYSFKSFGKYTKDGIEQGRI